MHQKRPGQRHEVSYQAVIKILATLLSLDDQVRIGTIYDSATLCPSSPPPPPPQPAPPDPGCFCFPEVLGEYKEVDYFQGQFATSSSLPWTLETELDSIPEPFVGMKLAFRLGDPENMFRIVINIGVPSGDPLTSFPFTFDFDFGGPDVSLFICLVKTYSAAEVRIIINEKPEECFTV